MSQSMKYKVNEIFCSLQGEGFNQGKRVIFLRLSGCNKSCAWCDTEHESYKEMSIVEILDNISKWDCKSVIISGGEPTIYNLLPLLKKLKENSYWIGIESNGSNSMGEYREYLDYIAISPKGKVEQKKVDEVRVVNSNVDVEYLKSVESEIEASRYFLSPLDSGGEMNIEETMKLLGEINEKGSKDWAMSLQLHKIVGIE